MPAPLDGSQTNNPTPGAVPPTKRRNPVWLVALVGFIVTSVVSCGVGAAIGASGSGASATVTAVATIVVTATPDPAPNEEAQEPTAEATFWDELPVTRLKEIIDQDAAVGACESLQDTFDTWDGSNLATGPKAELLVYIDDAMREAGCYS